MLTNIGAYGQTKKKLTSKTLFVFIYFVVDVSLEEKDKDKQ